MDTCVQRLHAGSSLLLFPQGTRAIRGEPLKFRLGAAEIAIRAEAEIVPIVIDCQPQMLAKHVPWYKIPPSPPCFRIKVLPPVTAGELVADDVPPRHARHELNANLVAMFEAELY
jgi:1-acyl-sn-glycerol-3-phosphate acyltransferase